MKLINKFIGWVFYFIDNFKSCGIYAKIENFKFEYSQKQIVVTYRLGRKNLLNRINLIDFERKFFERITSYDRYRLAKFSILQSLMTNIFLDNTYNKEKFLKFIEDQIKYEQLFWNYLSKAYSQN